MSDFTTLLSGVLNPDKTVRTNSETQITEMLTTSPQVLSTHLLTSMSSPDDSISSLSAVLYRKKIVESSIFTQFDDATKSTTLSTLITLVTPGRSLSFLKKIGDILANIANTTEWSTQFFTLCVNWGSTAELKEFSLYLMEISVEFPKLLTVVQENTDSVVTMLTGFFNDTNRETVLSAVNTLTALLSRLQEETKVMNYINLAGPIIQALISTTTGEKLKVTLSSIADLTEAFPRFWKDVSNVFVKSLTTIATAQIDSDTRSAAVEALVTFIHRAPGILKKDKEAIINICQTAMNLTYEIDYKDEFDEWTKDETDLSVTNNDPYSLGKDLLSKSAKFLEPANVLPFYLQTIPAFLKDPDWVKQHTALLTVGFIAEGCHDKFQENLHEILSMITPFATSQSPRLQWAYVTTIGLLSSEFEPSIQSSFHSMIVPALLNIITTTSNIKVQIQAVSALVNFTRGVLSEEDDEFDATPVITYANQTLRVLAGLLENTKSYRLMSQTLGAISTTATAMEEQFAPYYTEFMPALKKLVTMTFTTPEEQEVRANCVRCMGHCVESISENPAGQLEDVKAIMTGLVTLKSGLDADDPTALAINEVVSQFSDCLKTEFLPYMEVFMPDLLTKAEATVDIAFTDAEVEMPTGMNAVSFDIKGQGTKQLAVNTTVLQHKIKACRILYDLVSSLKTSFAPYVEATLRIMIPLFNYTYNGDIRKYSLKTVVAIFISQEPQSAETLLRLLAPAFIQTLNSPKSSPEDIKRTLKSLQACLEYTQNKAVIGLAAANEIALTTATCISNVFGRKGQRKAEMLNYQDADMYADEIEAIKEEEEIDDKILSGVMEVVGMLLKGFKKEFQGTFLQYFKTLYGEIFTKEGSTENEILAAICIFDDYIEHTQDLMWNGNTSPVLEQMAKYAYHKNADIRQSAVYGLGVCAQAIDSNTFSPFFTQTLELIRTVLKDPKARTDEYTVATDCAVGTLGKLAIFHNNGLIEEWLNYLPIKAEVEEAQNVHKMFFTYFDKVKAFPRCQTVIAELKSIKDEMIDKETLATYGHLIN